MGLPSVTVSSGELTWNCSGMAAPGLSMRKGGLAVRLWEVVECAGRGEVMDETTEVEEDELLSRMLNFDSIGHEEQ